MSATAYMNRALSILSQVQQSQLPALEAAGRKIADVVAAGGLVHIFGTGHSHLIAEEIVSRAGGLLAINAILEPSVMLHEGAAKSSAMEKTPGVARVLLDTQPVAAGDVMIVVSNSGRNALPVEMAELSRERGLYVIALTSLGHSRSVASKAPSGKRLFEVADLVIDNGGVPGDAVLEVPGSPVRYAPTSTVAGALLVLAETKDPGRKEAWGRRGAAFFQGRTRRTAAASERDPVSPPPQSDIAQSPSGGTGAA